MNERTIKDRFPNASASFIRANLSADPEIPHTEQRERETPLACDSQREAQSSSRPHVRFTLRRVRLLDVDAKYASVKDVLDGLAKMGVISGDREDQITLEVNQVKVAHYKDERTEIAIL